MKRRKLLTFTLLVFVLLGLIAPSFYPLNLVFANNLNEVNQRTDVQQSSEDFTGEEKSDDNKQNQQIEASTDEVSNVQNSQLRQAVNMSSEDVEGSLAINSSIVDQSNKPENKAEEGWIPTGAIADINIKLQASNKGNAKDDDVIKGLHADITIPRKYLEEDYFSKKGYQILGGNNLTIDDKADKDNIYLKVSSDELEVGSILAFQVRVKVKLPHYVNDQLVNPKIKHGSLIDIKGVLYDENDQIISDESYPLKIHAKSNYIARSNNYYNSNWLDKDDTQLDADKKKLVTDESILKDLKYYINVRDTYFWQATSHTSTGVYLPDKVKVKLTPKTLDQGEVKITDSSWMKDNDGSYYQYVIPTIKNRSTTEYVDANTSVSIKLPGYEIAKSHEVFDVSVVLVDDNDKEIAETESKTVTYSATYYINEERPSKPDEKIDLRTKVKFTNSGSYYYINNKDKATDWIYEITNDSRVDDINAKLYLGNIDNYTMERNFYIDKLSFDTSELKELDSNITYKLTAVDVDSRERVDLGNRNLSEVVTFESEKYILPKIEFSKAITLLKGETLKLNLTTKVFSQDYDNYDNYKNWKQGDKLSDYEIQNGQGILTDRRLSLGVAGYFFTSPDKEEKVTDRDVKYSSDFKTSGWIGIEIKALLGEVGMDQHPSYSHKLVDSDKFVSKNDRVVANTGDTVRMEIDVWTNINVSNKEELKTTLREMGQRQYLKNPKFLIEVPGFEDTLDISIKVKAKYGADTEYKDVNINKETRGGKEYYVVPLDDENLAEFIEDFTIQYDVTFKDNKRPQGLNEGYNLVYDNYGRNAFINGVGYEHHLEHDDRNDLNQDGKTNEKFLWGRYNVEYGSAFKVFGSTASLRHNEKNGKVVEDDYYNLKHNISNVYPLGAKHNLGLGIENKLDGPIKSMRIVDVLAHKNDKMQISGQERKSGTRLMLTGPVTVDTESKQFTNNKDAKFEITYSTAEPGNLAANLQANFVAESEITDWSEVKMFQIKLVSGQIDPGKLAIFKVPVVSDSEENVTAAKDGYIYAANGFAYGASVSSKDTLSDPKSYVETVTNYPRYEIVRTVKFESGDAGAINIGGELPFAKLITKKVKNNEAWNKNIKDIVPNKFFKIADLVNNNILKAANNYKWVAKDEKTAEWLDGKDISELDSEAINRDLTFEAKEIIKKENPNDDRYVKVTFKSTDKGKFEDNKTEISYWVLKGTKFADALNIEEYKAKDEKVKVIEIPDVENISGEFSGWNISEKEYSKELTEYNEALNADLEIIARYKVVEVDISYKFVSGTADKNLPKGVMDQLNNQALIKKGNAGDTVKAPEIEFTSVEDGEGSWKFKAWAPESKVLSIKSDENVFTGTWTWEKFTADKIIPYLPDEEEPDKGSDDKDIPKNYITVTFKSEDAAKGKVKVGTKEGVEVKAKVAPDTDLATAKDIMPVPAADYGFTKWDPKLGVAKAGNIYTAYFIKSGSEIKENDPIPEGWLKVTVKQDAESIKENTVEEKTYAVKPNDKLAEDKFPNLENSAKDGYEKPAWYKDMDKAPTTAPWDIEITKDTSFIAKAEAVKVTPTPEPTPEPTPTPEPEPQPTPTPEPEPSPEPKVEKIKIIFKPNEGKWADGSTEDKVLVVDKGTVIDIIKAPEREGYEFLYWKGSEYQPGEKYKAVEDHTFVAQWKKAAVVNPEPTPEEPSQSSKSAESSKVEKPTTSASKPTENKVTKTGEASYITMTTGLISIAIAGVLVLNRKKNEE